MLEILVPVVVLVNGLAAGVLMGTQLGGWPLLESLPPGRYVQAHAFFSTRFDPFMPICLIGTVLGDGALALLASPVATAALFGLAGVLALGTIAVSLVKNVPVNRWIRGLDPDDLPADFAEHDPRRHWGGWNRARSVLSVAALAANCAAVGLLL
ncbi:DUF1772 domain-containing protein [Nonomuraea sp. NBC_01738]|uniref:DUF1772 domain-containing protein n=1 Tax=Nonomuraea sp. NBC_01738 TaxID=2976003 RepID=UPI002E118F48|nr:DUF1772 domain-containing protein [Nonomuraea sp. NBC_01738]